LSPLNVYTMSFFLVAISGMDGNIFPVKFMLTPTWQPPNPLHYFMADLFAHTCSILLTVCWIVYVLLVYCYIYYEDNLNPWFLCSLWYLNITNRPISRFRVSNIAHRYCNSVLYLILNKHLFFIFLALKILSYLLFWTWDLKFCITIFFASFRPKFIQQNPLNFPMIDW
jgi:hypothetical protein